MKATDTAMNTWNEYCLAEFRNQYLVGSCYSDLTDEIQLFNFALKLENDIHKLLSVWNGAIPDGRVFELINLFLINRLDYFSFAGAYEQFCKHTNQAYDISL